MSNIALPSGSQLAPDLRSPDTSSAELLAEFERPDVALTAYRSLRRRSEELTRHLEPEDCAIQSMADVSPTRWHLAHTTWFFETFILRSLDAHYVSPNDQFEYLFNSYYNSVGQQFPRDRRGLLSRPTLREVWEYRAEIDQRIERLLTDKLDDHDWEKISATLQLGIQHEQQHQELMLTDIKHVFSCNPLLPAYSDASSSQVSYDGLGRCESLACEESLAEPLPDLSYFSIDGGIYCIGHKGHEFCYDNETPRHEVLLQDYEIASRLITNGEFLKFVEEGGYRSPSHWLSSGWSTVETERWEAPLYWTRRESQWLEFTLDGLRPLNKNEPVCHISFYEADAFARWAGARLPTEAEWEVFAAPYRNEPRAYGTFSGTVNLESQDSVGVAVGESAWHPRAASAISDYQGPYQVFGDCWQWTASQYLGYPGYRPAAGAIGEYNGKFMCNQFVLRGGSVATTRNHIRPTYRNFFPPDARWQFSGLRLAR